MKEQQKKVFDLTDTGVVELKLPPIEIPELPKKSKFSSDEFRKNLRKFVKLLAEMDGKPFAEQQNFWNIDRLVEPDPNKIYWNEYQQMPVARGEHDPRDHRGRRIICGMCGQPGCPYARFYPKVVRE